MNTYARVANGIVMELFTTSADIGTLFPPAIVWVNVTTLQGIQAGWVQNGTTFVPPPRRHRRSRPRLWPASRPS